MDTVLFPEYTVPIFHTVYIPLRWCNGKRAHFECGISWVRALVGQNQMQRMFKDYTIGNCAFPANLTE